MARTRAKGLDSHERIRDAAATTLRRDGVDGLSVHKVMQEAGLTVGGFYSHFDSRSELVADAFSTASGQRRKVVAKILEGKHAGDRLLGFVDAYLSDDHVNDRAGGCPWAAVLSDLPRTSEEMRTEVNDQFARSAAGLHPDRRAAIATLSLSFASLILMRTVTDGELRAEIAEAAQFAVGSIVEKVRRTDSEGEDK